VRVAVYVLVLANVLFFGWAHWIDVPPPPPPSSIAGLPKLTLVSELPPDKRLALAAAQKLALEKAAQVCVSVGPFDDPAVAGQAAALLKAKNFEPQQRAAEDPAVRRFWVYLRGFSSDASELRALHRLERAGIDDAEAMPADAGGRKVSLGLFTDKVRAARRARAVRTLGFNPAMTERLLPGTVYWLDLTLANSRVAVPLKEVSDLQPNGSSSPVTLQPCPPPSATAAPEQPQATAASPANASGTAPKAATAAAPPSATAKPALPLCKPGGPIPCIVVKERKQPSVL
jgi:hypothetical protein